MHRSRLHPDSRNRIHLHALWHVALESNSYRTSPVPEGVRSHEDARKWLISIEMMFERVLSTISRITTHGRFKDLTISMATDVLPEPELPAIPMILKSAHGGE